MTVFLKQESVGQPKEYVFAGVSQPRLCLPIFHFVKLSGLTPGEMATEVKTIATSQKGKRQNVLDRLSGKKTAHTKTLTLKARIICDQIRDGNLNTPTNSREVATFAQGVSGISETRASVPDILLALTKCRDLAVVADDTNALGAVFKAACRIDEIFFKP